MSKQELYNKGKKHAKAFEKNTLFATTDGQFFLQKGDADFHAGNKGLKVYELDYSEDETAEPVKPKTAKEVIAEINQAETEDVVLALIENEERKSVIEAADKRVEELNKSAE